MNNIRNKVGASIIFIILSGLHTIYCQTNDSTYINYLLNNYSSPKRNNQLTSNKNFLKTNFIQLFDGEVQAIWEHRLNEKFGFDIGPGFLLPYTSNSYFGVDTGFINDLPWFFSSGILFMYNNSEYRNEKFGISMFVEPKHYFLTKTKFLTTDHFSSIGPFYRFRSYSNLIINEVGVAYTNIASTGKFLYNLTYAFSYTIQSPIYNETDLKFFGKPTQNLNRFELPYFTSFRIYARMDIGYALNKFK